MTEKKILGYRKFESKKKEPFCIVQGVAPYSPKDVAHGAVGDKSEDIFVPAEYHSLFTPDCIGKMMLIDYYVDGGRAYILSVEVG